MSSSPKSAAEPTSSSLSTHHTVYLSDSRDMSALDDKTIGLVVTSPPYWSIKDYEHPGQIGAGQTYEEYLGGIEKVLQECFRVLKPGCRAAVNIGDQYLRARDHGRYRVQPIAADLAVRARSAGFDFMGNIIWRKISTTRTSGGGQWMGSIYYPKDGHVTYEHEYIILLKKPGSWKRPPDEEREASRIGKQERSDWFRGYWELAPERQEGHVAMFPLELPRRLILMYSFVGETIMDPFLGSGTTSRAAAEAGRHSVGYEISEVNEARILAKMSEEGASDAQKTCLGELRFVR